MTATSIRDNSDKNKTVYRLTTNADSDSQIYAINQASIVTLVKTGLVSDSYVVAYTFLEDKSVWKDVKTISSASDDITRLDVRGIKAIRISRSGAADGENIIDIGFTYQEGPLSPTDGTATQDVNVVNTVLPVKLYDKDGNEVGIQYPISVDGDSVYFKDIWIEESDATNWVDVDATGLDPSVIPFTNLHTRITNSTTDNPKVLRIHLNRSIKASQVGLGAITGNFSNVEIKLLGSAGVERTVFDDSANNDKLNSRNYPFEPQLFNAFDIYFHTVDAVTISNITIQKAREVDAFIQVQKPDGTVVNVQGTTHGNLKVSLEEIEDIVLPVTPVSYATQAIEDSVDSNLLYVGKADTGSLTSDAVWQIKRVDSTTGTIITWADGNDNFDNIFDNRESLTYS